MSQLFRVTLAQINTTVGDLAGNSRKILQAIREARQQPSDLIIFPELALTGYPPEDLLFQRSFVDANLKALQSIVAATEEGIAVIVGFVDRDPKGHLFNAAALIQNRQCRSIYRKVELPNYGVFDEKRYFIPGKRKGLMRLDKLGLGVTICEDIWQKSGAVYRAGFAKGLDFVVNISASPYHRGKQKERQRLVQNLARKLKKAVVYLNLIGGQDELVFDGGSMVVNPNGRILAKANRFQEQIFTVEFDRQQGVFIAKGSYAFGRDLRKEDEVYQTLVLGTRDYVLKNGFKKVLVGLSGGIDSSLVARIAVDAFGPNQVIGVTMPSRYTSRGTYRDAVQLAKNLNIKIFEFPIEGIFKEYLKAFKKIFSGYAPDITEENLQARIRGTLLMALSNKLGHLVLTTGNKSEMATGYCTLYGDMAGGFAVLKDVPKTLVFQLARFTNLTHPDGRIPLSVLKRPPTAELRLHQKDQDTLPRYSVLDRFLEDYVEKDVRIEKIIKKGVPAATATRIARMVDRNEYKRRQAPPGVKITPKAFGRDRRMPITNRFSR